MTLLMRLGTARCREEKVLLGLFILTVVLINPYIRGDGNGYYAYVRSLIIDGDLHFENEYRLGDPAFVRSAFDVEGRLTDGMRLPSGHVRNQWAVGSSVLWAPFFVAAHGLVRLTNSLGGSVQADGYSLPYRWLVALGTAVYGFLAILLSFRVAAHLTTRADALVAAIGIWFASPLPVYAYFLPFQAHALAAFAVALFIWYWWRTAGARSLWQWWVWGLSAGLMVAVYYVNALLIVISALDLVRLWARQRRLAGAALAGVAFAGGVVLALLPHWVTRWVLFRSVLVTGYSDEFFWTSPRLLEVGWASEHGMFLWTPILLLAVAGLALMARRDLTVAGPALLCLALFYYTIAAFQNWHGQSSFGNRFFVSLTPLFVMGLAWLVCRARAVTSRWLVHGVVALLIAWNIGFIFQWGSKLVPNRGPVDFPTVARNQVTAVPSRLFSFGLRYLTMKDEVISEVEREDFIESTRYRLKR